MRILWLYKYLKNYNFDHHLHMDYARFLSKFEGIELKAYGPQIELGYPELSLINYSPDLLLSHLHHLYNFDVIIVNTKSRAFINYDPHRNIAEGCWLPKDFSVYNCPKVVIEEDYHYEKNDVWYQQMNIDLILQRHYSQSLRQDITKMQFFPFSVDMETFGCENTWCNYENSKIPLNFTKKNKIGFIGHDQRDVYKYRKIAITELAKKNLVDAYSGTKKIDAEYIQILRQYLAFVSCGSIYEICAAKNFEIMASGGLLFTNKFLGIDKLFPENAYCCYNNDGSDVIEKGKKIIEDKYYRESTILAATRCIKEKHTHEVRTKELIKIIEDLR